MMYMATRTTVTLDEDVKAKVKAEMRRQGRSFKEVVNEGLRRGLDDRLEQKKIPPFKIKPRDLGLRPGLSYDCVWDLIAAAEGPFYK
jgi:hypothetical protein